MSDRWLQNVINLHVGRQLVPRTLGKPGAIFTPGGGQYPSGEATTSDGPRLVAGFGLLSSSKLESG